MRNNERNVFSDFLASLLSVKGSRRECYNSGNLSGVPRSKFMESMEWACVLRLDTLMEGFGSVRSDLPSLLLLKSRLLTYAKVNNGDSENNIRGVGYCFFKFCAFLKGCCMETSTTTCRSEPVLIIVRPDTYPKAAHFSCPRWTVCKEDWDFWRVRFRAIPTSLQEYGPSTLT